VALVAVSLRRRRRCLVRQRLFPCLRRCLVRQGLFPCLRRCLGSVRDSFAFGAVWSVRDYFRAFGAVWSVRDYFRAFGAVWGPSGSLSPSALFGPSGTFFVPWALVGA